MRSKPAQRDAAITLHTQLLLSRSWIHWGRSSFTTLLSLRGEGAAPKDRGSKGVRSVLSV